MIRCIIFLLGVMVGVNVYSHEFTPTYPRLEPTVERDILQVNMHIFNKRQDVEYYQFQVYDTEWNLVPFAMMQKILKIGYLEKKDVIIYLRRKDSDKAMYICSLSKLKKEDVRHTAIQTKICSKIKR